MAAQKFPITEGQIVQLVTAFYARIRTHPELAPIFLRAIGTDRAAWQHHEAHIASFWRNAVGLDRSYSGNPMAKHLAISDIQPEHFPLWLALFRATAQDVLPPPAAASMAALADRIGRSLSWGMAQYRQPTGSAPSLRPMG